MLSPGDVAQVITTTSDIHEHTNDLLSIKRRDSQLLFGENFEIELIDGDWVFGTSVLDGYEGFVALDTLQKQDHTPTHYVSHTLSHIYPAPDFKMRPSLPVSFKSVLFCSDMRDNGFIEVPGFGWVFESHLTAIGSAPNSVGDCVLGFLSVPYLYGGRSALGVDCSGLTQVILQACGIDCPRDSDQQLGKGVTGNPAQFQAGDLVFFKDHVGIMIDNTNILNATARSMDTRIEPVAMLAEIYGGILGYWRV